MLATSIFWNRGMGTPVSTPAVDNFCIRHQRENCDGKNGQQHSDAKTKCHSVHALVILILFGKKEVPRRDELT